MKLLITITTQDINPEAPIVDHADFSRRDTVRAVVLDSRNKVALLNVAKKGFHKLPGGGIDEGETMENALKRELLEELGVRAEIIAEIGEIHEFWDEEQQMQISSCYLARQVGEQTSPSFTEKEQESGFQALWVETVDEAITMLKADHPAGHAGKHIVLRDLLFLETARGIIERRNQ